MKKTNREKVKTKKMKTYSLDHMLDKHIGKRGTKKREDFEYELSLDLLGEAIKRAREARNLTQAQLGALVGVQRAQISKLENSMKDARVETIIRVFHAMKATINFNVTLNRI